MGKVLGPVSEVLGQVSVTSDEGKETGLTYGYDDNGDIVVYQSTLSAPPAATPDTLQSSHGAFRADIYLDEKPVTTVVSWGLGSNPPKDLDPGVEFYRLDCRVLRVEYHSGDAGQWIRVVHGDPSIWLPYQERYRTTYDSVKKKCTKVCTHPV